MIVHLIDLYMVVTLKHMLTALILFSEKQINPMKNLPDILLLKNQ